MINNVCVEPFILANKLIFRDIRYKNFYDSLDVSFCRERVFQGFRSSHYAIPDHVFSHRWDSFLSSRHKLYEKFACGVSRSNVPQWVVPSLDSMAYLFLEYRDGRLWVKWEAFSLWQSIISGVSWLPIKAAFWGLLGFDGKHIPQKADAFPFYPTPHDLSLESFACRNGLNETHLHLNGSTPAEVIWLRAMIDPEAELRDFFNAYSTKSKVRELCTSVDETLSPEEMLFRCRLARQCRTLLVNLLRGLVQKMPPTIYSLMYCDSFWPCQLKDLQKEEEWQVDILNFLRKKPNIVVDRIFHLYLLIKNQFIQLLVQREDFFGFDQFQKVTLQDLREQEEKSFYRRFKQFHGVADEPSEVNLLEGRFAPKDSVSKNKDLMYKIFIGYREYLEDYSSQDKIVWRGRPMGVPQKPPFSQGSLKSLLDDVKRLELEATRTRLRLSLVAHFIKGPWSFSDESSYFNNLRSDLRKRFLVLKNTMNKWEMLKHWLRGIDAASNEMDTPPEVFAPVFRLCRRLGIERATYHVGEDFLHLAGGIRQIDDALRFLDLREGDRLGHCTAVGIEPGIWLRTMPKSLFVRRGDAFLDALSMWRHFRYKNGGVAAKMASCALLWGCEIFKEELSLEKLDRIMELRYLDPEFVFAYVDDSSRFWRFTSLDDDIREEDRIVWQIKEKEGHERLRYLAKWWRYRSVLSRAWKEYVELPGDFFDEESLIRYQQYVLSDIAQKSIVIESLPTSNVRISQYRGIADHHIFRWMGVPERSLEGDPKIMVTLGTDDPGIFATSLKGEFYHLYLSLVKNFGMLDHEAIGYLHSLNQRGYDYSFHAKKQ